MTSNYKVPRKKIYEVHPLTSVTAGKGNKSKNKQMGPYQTNSFCTAKETTNKTKRQSI